MRERNSATSSERYSVGRHMRGDWLKIWSASQPNSTPRSYDLTSPPELETWPPISTDGTVQAVRAASGRMPQAAKVKRVRTGADTRSRVLNIPDIGAD